MSYEDRLRSWSEEHPPPEGSRVPHRCPYCEVGRRRRRTPEQKRVLEAWCMELKVWEGYEVRWARLVEKDATQFRLEALEGCRRRVELYRSLLEKELGLREADPEVDLWE